MKKTTTTQHNLTRHAPGSISELLALSIPLILTALSGSFKLTLDRIMLSYYSLDALHALAGINIVLAVFYLPGIAITGMSEVFVGQYNGSRQYHKVAAPVWQMIWLSLFSIVIYVPLAFWGDSLFIADAYFDAGQMYYQIIVCFCPFWLVQAALSGFFIGIGRPSIVTYVTLLGTVLNFVLNYILIFGFWAIPALGALGAAIASVLASLVEIYILFSVFLSSKNVQQFNTRKVTFNPSLLLSAFKVGVPNAIGHTLEVGAWAFVSNFRSTLGMEHILINTLTSTAFISFTFITDGLNKAVTAITANLIGSNQLHLLPQLKKSTLKVILVLSFILFILLVLFSSATIHAVLHSTNFSESVLLSMKLSLFGTFLFMSLDAFFWTSSGILTAGGDTRYIMVVNSVSVWLLAVIPAVFIALYISNAAYIISLFCWPLYIGITNIFIHKRLASNQWIKLDLKS